jgi:hypothetical protein
MDAVLASSSAMAAVVGSSTAMDAVAASSSAMDAVIASSTAMAACFDSLVAKAAIWGSDVAVGAIAGSTPAYDWLLANKTTTSAATNIATSPGTAFDVGKSLLLNWVANGTGANIYFTTKNGSVGNAGPIAFTTTVSKNIMAATDLKAYESASNTYLFTLKYVIMD